MKPITRTLEPTHVWGASKYAPNDCEDTGEEIVKLEKNEKQSSLLESWQCRGVHRNEVCLR